MSNAEYYQKNRERILIKVKEYYKQNEDKIKKYKSSYYQRNKDKISAYHKKYRADHYEDTIRPRKERNRAETAQRMRSYRAKRIKKDPQYKLAINLRNRLLQAIKSGTKSGSSVRDLGCSISELKNYLERRFAPGMSWNNWGRKGWNIDHIKPLKAFDLTDRKQFLSACHYTNLQPLWWYDNLAKRFK